MYICTTCIWQYKEVPVTTHIQVHLITTIQSVFDNNLLIQSLFAVAVVSLQLTIAMHCFDDVCASISQQKMDVSFWVVLLYSSHNWVGLAANYCPVCYSSRGVAAKIACFLRKSFVAEYFCGYRLWIMPIVLIIGPVVSMTADSVQPHLAICRV